MPRPRSVLGLLTLLTPLAATGCGDDDGGPTPTPLDPASLRLVSVTSAGGPTERVNQLTCVPVGLDPDQSLVIAARADNWSLRPLGACNALHQCGLIRFTLSADDASFEPIVTLSALSTGSLALKGTQLGPETPVTLEARLVDDLGEEYADPDRQPDAGDSCDQIPECDRVGFRLDADCGLDRPSDQDVAPTAPAPDASMNGQGPSDAGMP